MEIIYHLNEPSGYPVVTVDAGIPTLGQVDTSYIWSCGVCGGETRGKFERHETSSRSVFGTELGAICCPLGEVETTHWGLECRHPKGSWREGSSIYFKIHWGRDGGRSGQGRYILEGLVKAKKAKVA